MINGAREPPRATRLPPDLIQRIFSSRACTDLSNALSE